MNIIINYIENIFSNLPKTEESKRMKEELIQNSSEKYDDLIAQGKSDKEAIGIVISEFGDFEELKRELFDENDLNMEKNSKVRNSSPLLNTDSPEYSEKMDEYFKARKIQPIITSIAVLIFISSGPLFAYLSDHYKLSDGFMGLSISISIGIGVFMLIISGMKMKALKEDLGITTDNDYEYKSSLREDFEDNKKMNQIKSIIYLSATVIYMIIGFVFHLWHPGWVIYLVAAIVVALIRLKSN